MTTRAGPQRPRGQAARLAVFYAASFLVVGVQLPFWPVWLTGRGLDAREIGWVFAAAIWVKVITTPAIGALADRVGRRRAVMAVFAGIAVAAYAGLWPVSGFLALVVLTVVAGVAQSALMPLGDSVTLAAVRGDGIDYGRVRVWGSISFVVASVGSGAALAAAPEVAHGGNAVLFLVLCASLLLLAACLGMPARGLPMMALTSRWLALGQLLGDRRFWLFVVSAAALQSSHQLYYGFGTLYWRRLGFSDTVIGALWAEGVVAEIALFWFNARFVARLGPLGLMAGRGGSDSNYGSSVGASTLLIQASSA